jgi:hypothetical protein
MTFDTRCGSNCRRGPIREADVDIDYPAVMGSRERLWAKYGQASGWPPVDMSYAADRKDLARHEVEIAAHETFKRVGASTPGVRAPLACRDLGIPLGSLLSLIGAQPSPPRLPTPLEISSTP